MAPLRKMKDEGEMNKQDIYNALTEASIDLGNMDKVPRRITRTFKPHIENQIDPEIAYMANAVWEKLRDPATLWQGR